MYHLSQKCIPLTNTLTEKMCKHFVEGVHSIVVLRTVWRCPVLVLWSDSCEVRVALVCCWRHFSRNTALILYSTLSRYIVNSNYYIYRGICRQTAIDEYSIYSYIETILLLRFLCEYRACYNLRFAWKWHS